MATPEPLPALLPSSRAATAALRARPERDDAALALGQGTGDSGTFAARVLSGAEGPRAGVVKALTGSAASRWARRPLPSA